MTAALLPRTPPQLAQAQELLNEALVQYVQPIDEDRVDLQHLIANKLINWRG
jgi:hypothetical protein